MLQRIRNRPTAVLTGWALDPGAKFRYGCDAAFPLTDHADYPDLIRYVELVKPERVLTLHGFASAFAADLRDRGIEAWALSEENQLELMPGSRTPSASDADVGGNDEERPATASAAVPSPTDFQAFAQLG